MLHYLMCRIWDIECGACLRLLEGHDELVRCIRFDDKRIVSGAYDGCVICVVCLVYIYKTCVCECLCMYNVCCSVGMGDIDNCVYNYYTERISQLSRLFCTLYMQVYQTVLK